MTRTVLLDGDSAVDRTRAVEILASGGVVGVPTETVYGLAADAGNDAAVGKVFAAKGRPTSHPLIIHVADVTAARRLAEPWPRSADILAAAFWPGPITLLVRRSELVSPAVTGGRDTVAIRVPDHPVFGELLTDLSERGCVGLAAPSANKFGSVSPTSAEHVLGDLDGLIDAVLDGGTCRVGVESTIVDCTITVPRILRPGGVSVEDIRRALADRGIELDDARAVADAEPIAPGMLPSHYAPRARVETFDDMVGLEARRTELTERGVKVEVLAHPGDSHDYSRVLYSSLRECDERGAEVILALLPDDWGLGRAIRDRLAKAAANR